MHILIAYAPQNVQEQKKKAFLSAMAMSVKLIFFENFYQNVHRQTARQRPNGFLPAVCQRFLLRHGVMGHAQDGGGNSNKSFLKEFPDNKSSILDELASK